MLAERNILYTLTVKPVKHSPILPGQQQQPQQNNSRRRTTDAMPLGERRRCVFE